MIKKLAIDNNKKKKKEENVGEVDRRSSASIRKRYKFNHPVPQKTTKTRQRAANEKNVIGAHNSLGERLEILGFKEKGGEIYPHKRERVIIVDETGGKAPKHNEKVATIAGVQARKAGGATPPHVTVFGAINLAGFGYPPLLICPKTLHIPPDVVTALETSRFKKDVLITTSEEGYINKELFFDILGRLVDKFFTGRKKPTKSNPVIVVADGHTSRLCPFGLRFFQEKNILLFIGAPNATHIYSPLDDCVFKQYNHIRRRRRLQWGNNNNNPNWHDHAVEAFICAESWWDTVRVTDQYAMAAFKNVGLLPWNSEQLKTFSSIVFGVDVDNSASQILPKEPTQTRDLFYMGGWATDEDNILFMEEHSKQQ